MDRNKISVFEDICRIITDSMNPQKTLETIVRLVADRFGIDVCSVYLFDEKKNYLVLRATVGLSKKSVGTIRMSIREGLTGMVLEKMKPVFVLNPSTHPRYKYFEGSGEEIYKTFLGLPLIYHQKNLGVIVIQTLNENAVSEEDIPVFSAITSQIAATVAYSGLLEDIKKKRNERDLKVSLSEVKKKKPPKKERKKLLRGLPVSAGFAEGYAHYLGESIGFDQIQYEDAEDIESEIERLETAFNRSVEEIRSLAKQLKDLPSQDKAILDVHLMLLRDGAFKNKIIDHIREGYCAEYSLKKEVQKHVEFFRSIDDPYLRERGSDIEDMGKQVLRNLLGLEGQPTKELKQKTIVIASDISPADLVGLRQPNLKGIVLSKGGKTSHTVIIAKSFEIPMVIGVKDVLETVRENDLLIIDGKSGLVFKEPSQTIIDEYAHLKAEKEKKFQQLDLLRNLKSETKDGYEVKLGANIGLLSDTELVKKYGADHIGLYRTEFPFLARKEFPTEDEQFSLYKKIISSAEGRAVTIRTLDVGGDKFLPYLDYPKEQNPYLGWRSIRVSLELDDVFRTQIRAVLRASAFGKLKLLFPMITSVGEIRKISRILNEEKTSLESKGIPFDQEINIGIMVEVPAAIKILDRLLRYVDFVSIGTNDLIQYTLAVDRNNEKVASIYNPLHPAVISTILDVVSICKKNGKKVSICGEAASNPQCAYLFLAMEADQLSMNPASIPIIKALIRKVKLADAKEVLNSVLLMEDEEMISDFLNSDLTLKLSS